MSASSVIFWAVILIQSIPCALAFVGMILEIVLICAEGTRPQSAAQDTSSLHKL